MMKAKEKKKESCLWVEKKKRYKRVNLSKKMGETVHPRGSIKKTNKGHFQSGYQIGASQQAGCEGKPWLFRCCVVDFPLSSFLFFLFLNKQTHKREEKRYPSTVIASDWSQQNSLSASPPHSFTAQIRL